MTRWHYVLLGPLLVCGCDADDPEPLPACPGGRADIDLEVRMPDNPDAEVELNVDDERQMTCEFGAALGDASAGWELALSCPADGTADAGEYIIDVVAPDSPFSWIDPTAPVVLNVHKFNYFEVGAGTRLAVTQRSEVGLVAIHESGGGGSVHMCLLPEDGFRAAVQPWLDRVDARLQQDTCSDEAVFGVAVGDDEVMPTYPGQQAQLAGGRTIVVGAAECRVYSGTAENWEIRMLVHASGPAQ